MSRPAAQKQPTAALIEIGGVPFVRPAAKAVQPPAQITRAELDARDDRIYERDERRIRTHKYGG